MVRSESKRSPSTVTDVEKSLCALLYGIEKVKVVATHFLVQILSCI